MKLEKILDQLNSFEKNSFLKIIDSIISEKPRNARQIDKILSDASGDLKAMDSLNISKVFQLVEQEFSEYLNQQLMNSTSQLSILTDILVRDGNCIMKQDWLSRLYDSELKKLKTKIKYTEGQIKSDKSDLSPDRQRDYTIYLECIRTAYFNDEINNQEKKVTFEEQTILNTLSDQLELSREEVKLINYMILPLEHLQIDTIINELKGLGVIFYVKKTSTIFIADEVVTIIRKLKGKTVADKFFRRVLRQLREPLINIVCRKHNIDWKQPFEVKIKEIINQGISFSSIISNDIHKENTTLTEKKKFVNELWDKKLKIKETLKGVTLEEKLGSLVNYFEEIEKDDKVGISVSGFEKLLVELQDYLPKSNTYIKNEFELQDENAMRSSYLLNFNIKPRDVLEIIPGNDLQKFCIKQGIKTRGDLVYNILDFYKDAENLYLENYQSIGYRDLASLKENGIKVKEAKLGVLFEDLTKKVLSKLGFNVDEKLRKQISTKKNKIDIVINMDNDEIIIVECKSVKESGYNKFSSVSRQVKSYINQAEKTDFKVIKSLLIAPEFSDDFVKECGLDYELNLSLISAKSLIKILQAFEDSKLKKFPHNLLMRDVLVQEDRVIKAISK